jgi:transposase
MKTVFNNKSIYTKRNGLEQPDKVSRGIRRLLEFHKHTLKLCRSEIFDEEWTTKYLKMLNIYE